LYPGDRHQAQVFQTFRGGCVGDLVVDHAIWVLEPFSDPCDGYQDLWMLLLLLLLLPRLR
jgi:hypothetical protein